MQQNKEEEEWNKEKSNRVQTSNLILFKQLLDEYAMIGIRLKDEKEKQLFYYFNFSVLFIWSFFLIFKETYLCDKSFGREDL